MRILIVGGALGIGILGLVAPSAGAGDVAKQCRTKFGIQSDSPIVCSVERIVPITEFAILPKPVFDFTDLDVVDDAISDRIPLRGSSRFANLSRLAEAPYRTLYWAVSAYGGQAINHITLKT